MIMIIIITKTEKNYYTHKNFSLWISSVNEIESLIENFIFCAMNLS